MVRHPNMSAGYSDFYIDLFYNISSTHVLWMLFYNLGPIDKLKYKLQQREFSQGGMFIYSRSSSQFDKKRSSTPKTSGPEEFLFSNFCYEHILWVPIFATRHLCPFLNQKIDPMRKEGMFALDAGCFWAPIVSTNNGICVCVCIYVRVISVITYHDVRCPTCFFPNHKLTE